MKVEKEGGLPVKESRLIDLLVDQLDCSHNGMYCDECRIQDDCYTTWDTTVSKQPVSEKRLPVLNTKLKILRMRSYYYRCLNV